MDYNLTEKFVEDLYSLSKVDFTDSVVLQAKRCLLDYLGVTLAGAQMLQEKGRKLLAYLDNDQGGASVIGFGRKADIGNAAFINGLSAHVAELDDGVRFGMLHPGSPIFSALLPLAEKEKITGTDLLLGTIVGYEAAVRVACAIQPSHYNIGFHPTSTCGAIGAAIGIAVMLGFTKTQMKDALASAAISASGTLKVLEDGSELKPFNVGRAAQVGLLSASIARAGFAGPSDPFSGRSGFLSMMTETYDLSQLETKKGDPFGIEKVYVKPYAACRHAHAAIEAALNIRARSGVRVGDIETIRVVTYRGVLGKHDHTKIWGSSSAKMSIPYGVATALTFGKVGIEDFAAECISDSGIAELTRKVVVCSDDEITSLVPQKRAAIVEITTYNGNLHIERVDYPKGEPENPLTDEEIKDKFTSLAAYGHKTREESDEIIRVVWCLEKDIHNLFTLL